MKLVKQNNFIKIKSLNNANLTYRQNPNEK